MPSRPAWLFAMLAVVVLGAAAWVSVRARAHPLPRSMTGGLDPRTWPGELAPLARVSPEFPAGSAPIRVMLDPGHGAPGNRGNTSSFCVDEQDAMLELAEALARRLEATGHVETKLARDPGRLVDYAARLQDAASWGAQAFVSLHSDVRGTVSRWAPEPDRDCPVAVDAPGFAVLYSDEGEPGTAARRLALGRAVARRMSEAGLLAYGGAEYIGSYVPDGAERGVFVDRHPFDQRIFVLRRAAMPSILVETHNALDPREAARWREPDTLDAFAAAVAAALADVLAKQPAFL